MPSGIPHKGVYISPSYCSIWPSFLLFAVPAVICLILSSLFFFFFFLFFFLSFWFALSSAPGASGRIMFYLRIDDFGIW